MSLYFPYLIEIIDKHEQEICVLIFNLIRMYGSIYYNEESPNSKVYNKHEENKQFH